MNLVALKKQLALFSIKNRIFTMGKYFDFAEGAASPIGM